MTRLEATFEACAAEGRAALVGYMTAFDPDREGSIERMCAACEAGVDVLEVGVPFSDPSADGPDVQAAMVRALDAGSTLGGVLEVVSAVRARHDTPIVLFSYCNPLLSRPAGVDATMKEAAQAGVDAVLVVDLLPESAAMLRDPRGPLGRLVGLVAPTSHEARRARICDISTGFVYAVSLTGVTGSAPIPRTRGFGPISRSFERIEPRCAWDSVCVRGIRWRSPPWWMASLWGARWCVPPRRGPRRCGRWCATSPRAWLDPESRGPRPRRLR